MRRALVIVLMAVFCLVLGLATSDAAREKSGIIYDIKGKAELVNSSGKTVLLERGRHLLLPVREGDRIITGDAGRVIVVSTANRTGYEIAPNSEVRVDSTTVSAIRGSIKSSGGFSIPSGKTSGPMGAMVFRSDDKTEQCISMVSPANCSIMTLTPQLVWKTGCAGTGNVKVRITDSNKKVVFETESAVSSLSVPAGVLQYGHVYSWRVSDGSASVRGDSDFTVLSESLVERVKGHVASVKASDKDVPARLSLMFYLLENNLKDDAKAEYSSLISEFPDNGYLKEL